MITRRIFPCIKLFEIAIQTAFLHQSKKGISAKNLLYSGISIKNAGTQLLTNELILQKMLLLHQKKEIEKCKSALFCWPFSEFRTGSSGSRVTIFENHVNLGRFRQVIDDYLFWKSGKFWKD